MENYEYDKYVTTSDKVMKKINKYGVAIIPNILNKNEITNMRAGIWDYLSHITSKFEKPITQNDETSWKQIRELFPMHSMLIQHWGIGHVQFNWDVRQNKKVIDVFAKIWSVNPDELLTSFDGASVHMPPEVTNIGWYRGNDWYHCDQSFTRHDFECIQSWVTAYDVEAGDATLAFLEKSNRLHEDFSNDMNIKEKKDWYKLDEKGVDYFLNKGCKKKYIKCPAGSMVLWDSRTIHCGRECHRERKKANFRGVSYVCMMPRKITPDKVIQKRIKAFEELRSTTHWANKGMLFPKTPRTYGKDLPDITPVDKPNLTETGLKLVGY